MGQDIEEVSLEAGLTERGVSVKARSRFLSALDGFGGDLVDFVRIGIEGINGRRRARNELKESIINTSGKVLINSCDVQPDVVAELLGQSIIREIDDSNNIEDIIEKSISYVIENDSSSQDQNLSDDIEPEWTSAFRDYAKRVSATDLQEMWAQVLAAKVSKGQFSSPSILRVVSELTPQVAKDFQELIEHAISEEIVLKRKSLSGDELLRFVDLEESGLMIESSGMGITREHSGGEDVVDLHNGFAMIAKSKKDFSVRLNTVKLTAAGKDIRRILPNNKSYKLLERLGEYYEDHVEEVSVNKVIDLVGNRANLQLIRKIK